MKLVANHLIYLAHDKIVQPDEPFAVDAAVGKALRESGAARAATIDDEPAEPVKGADEKGAKK